MGTNYIAPIWRMPRNFNKDKLSNYSIDFDGSSEFIDCGNPTALQFTSDFSITGWFKTSSTSAGVIISKDNVNNRSWIVLVENDGSVKGFIFEGNSAAKIVPSSTGYNDGNWHHFGFTYEEGVGLKLYIDGGTPATLPYTSAPNLNQSANVEIGRLGNGISSFDGSISQLAIFDYALSEDQINYLYNLNNPMVITGAEPIAYWPLGDNSNPNANAGYPSISVGADSVFDGDGTGFVVTKTGDEFHISTKFSFSLWLNMQTIVNYDHVFGASNGSWTEGFGLFQDGSNGTLRFFVDQYNTNGKFVNTDTTLDVNRWYHICGTFDNTNGGLLYVDGQAQNSGTAFTSATLTSIDLNKIIRIFGTTSGYTIDALISNFQLWNTELSSSEALTLYNNGQPLMTGTQPQEANLQAWYKLNQSANWEADTAGNWQIPDAVSSYPQSFDFDATSDIINFSTIDLGTTHTISMWVKITATSFANIISGTGGSAIKLNAPNRIYYYTNNYTNTQPIISTPLNQWNNIVIVRETTTVKFYVNNSLLQTTTLSVNADNFTFNKILGLDVNNKTSNIQLWDSALPATGTDSVETLYNNGSPLTTAIATDNLKAWYKLDNTELFDGNNWSISNQKYPANYTSALYFTGGAGNEHLDTPSNSDLLMAGSHTFSAWIYVNSSQTDSTNYIFDKGALDYSLGFSANALRLIYYNYYNSGGASGSNKIIVLDPDWKTTYQNGWHHIFVSVDQPNLTVTLVTDGTDISTYALPSDYVSPDQGGGALNIMSFNGATLSLAGFISNLAFFNGTALTTSQALTLYNNGTPENSISFSPTSWWKIDNTSTGLLDNAGTANLTNTGGVEKNIFVSAEAGVSSGMTEQNLVNNNVSALNGESVGMDTTNLVQSNLTRKQPFSNYSIDYNGTDEKITLASSISTGNNYTVSFWLNPDNISSGNSYIFSDSTTSPYKGLALDQGSSTAGGFGNFYYYTGSVVVVNNTSISGDVWSHIAIVFDVTAQEIKFYINGSLDKTTTSVANIGTSINEFATRSAGNYFNGKLSNVSIFNQVLSEDDVLKLYNNGITQNLNNFRITPIAWYPMDQSYTYFNGSVLVARDVISANNGTGTNVIQENIVGNAPGSEASGTGTNLTISDLKGNMYNSDKNAYSINMADYADGVTNPANSGRSTDVP